MYSETQQKPYSLKPPKQSLALLRVYQTVRTEEVCILIILETNSNTTRPTVGGQRQIFSRLSDNLSTRHSVSFARGSS